MPDADTADVAGAADAVDARWHLEPYDADVDDAPKGEADDCNGDGDPLEGDELGPP